VNPVPIRNPDAAGGAVGYEDHVIFPIYLGEVRNLAVVALITVG